ncbi:MAG: hypothetical protein JXM69_01295 [Anaerolineae bacterium]|nr:hypothetical protein [Anaerolineae bacterium]
MFKDEIDFETLPPGIYYWCDQCGWWYGQEEPELGSRCVNEACGVTFIDDRFIGMYRAALSGQAQDTAPGLEKLSCAYVIIGLAIFGMLILICSPAMDSAQIAWQGFGAGVASFFGAVGSLLFSLVSLVVATILLFGLLSLLLRLLPYLLVTLVGFFFAGNRPPVTVRRIENSLNIHNLWVGTIINLLASLGALAIVSLFMQRWPGLWDFASQILIALAIEIYLLRNRWLKK